ncbi:hypothetical protein FOL47_007487 [Perkinsus chesapeaki]|uniref:Uncharacterized protein n=1 Tax=Perkinsus chesapeaki TaxID=330153 RepID=A0A7J6LKV7_PERCH|nr:hypothetical protein FOL47_007487 [Perkinsus chesapeaki]
MYPISILLVCILSISRVLTDFPFKGNVYCRANFGGAFEKLLFLEVPLTVVLSVYDWDYPYHVSDYTYDEANGSLNLTHAVRWIPSHEFWQPGWWDRLDYDHALDGWAVGRAHPRWFRRC